MSYKVSSNVGKATFLTIFLGVVALLLGMMIDSRHPGQFQTAMATSTVATSVTVTNTPPVWNGSTAEEDPASFTDTPTNTGSPVTWVTTAKDNNGEDYFLLICKNGNAPTAHENRKPECDSLANQWGVSGTTTSETQASVATTTTEAMAEEQPWWGWICDANGSDASCNATPSQGTGNSGSPFMVNHRPTFTAYSDNSPANPGVQVTWTTTASDADASSTADMVNLFVCKADDFTGSACGAGGTYCTSGLVAANPTCNFTLESIKQDSQYGAYGFVIDTHNHAALDTNGVSGYQGENSVLGVLNVAPTISASSVNLLNTDDDPSTLILTTAHGQTTGFKTTFTVTDNNSCIATSTANEISSAILNVYRSDIAITSCDESGDFNTNQCYTDAVATGMWQPVCTQDALSCSGAADNQVTWTCTFPLWYNAEPTGTGTRYPAGKWYASVQAYDKYSLVSTATSTEDASAPILQMLLAYDVPVASIAYDALEPGGDSTTLSKTTRLAAWGNVGMDEVLYGEDMCTAADRTACEGGITRTIYAESQEFGLSALGYGAGTDLLEDTAGQTLVLDVSKTTATDTPEYKDTYWGIAIPSDITLAGNYVGQNFVAGKVSAPGTW